MKNHAQVLVTERLSGLLLIDPLRCSGQSFAPGFQKFFTDGWSRRWDKAAVGLPLFADLFRVFPESDGEASEVSGAEGSRFGNARTNDGHAEQIGLKLH